MAIIYGTPGNDSGLIGTELADEIYGLEGNDTLIGRAGNDILVGGPGKDYLEGGPGDDILTGGEGKDIFVLYYSGGGIDRIPDYTVGTDSIRLTSARNRPSIDTLTLGIAPPESYLSYNAATGALSYLIGQPNIWEQIATLPTGLDWNQLKNDIHGISSV